MESGLLLPYEVPTGDLKDILQFNVKINGAAFVIFGFPDFKPDNTLISIYLSPSDAGNFRYAPASLYPNVTKPLR
jgi:hypothetical protein